jgi:predicted ribosome quality control (RQC) complex YloA/Tae2 family protein
VSLWDGATLRAAGGGAGSTRGVVEYRLPGDWIVLAGKSDEDNERVSLALASQRDWWFHVAGVPGSHVVLRAKDGEEPGRDTLRQAAAVAAYHSKARNAGVVPVHCARARDVRKPRGAEVGTVEVSRGSTLKVRPDVSFAERIR